MIDRTRHREDHSISAPPMWPAWRKSPRPSSRSTCSAPLLYAAPEYFLGEAGNSRADLYSLGVIAYQMLAGDFPYGTQVPKSRTRAAPKKLAYRSVLREDREIPAWVNDAIAKAVHPDPYQRYEEISEFIFDLHHPSQAFLSKTRPPLIERHPVAFWKGVSFVLAGLLIVSLLSRAHGVA